MPAQTYTPEHVSIHPLELNPIEEWTALHLVTESIEEDAWEILFESGADINAKTSSGLTPLMAAVENLNAAFVQRLLDAGADASIRTRDGRNVLHFAAEKCSVRVLRILLTACTVADMNAQTHDGVTPLVCATMQEYLDAQDRRASSPPRSIAKYSDCAWADRARLS
eukprot:m.512718 g.512718  ORF g.512718 m.512718 type:complete len:167 (-) comp57438_c0_seq34:479-979(-)